MGAMCAFWSESFDAWPGGRGFSKGTANDEGLGDSTKVLSTFTSVSLGIGLASTLGGGGERVASCTTPLKSCSGIIFDSSLTAFRPSPCCASNRLRALLQRNRRRFVKDK